MQRWFLSYHSPDQAMAERLKAAIERKDSTSRVFFAPMHMRAGGSWSAQLAQEIAGATAFILLIGKEVGPWQVLEYDEALDKWAKWPSSFPLIVILLEGQTAPGLPFLRRLHWIITPDPSSEKDVGRLFDAASGGGSSRRSDLWRYTSPYRGLAAMDEKDSDYFFGRTRETVDVLSALAGAPNRLPLLIGNSGVGKSSLAQAGVLAALKRQAWPEEVQTPNAWPVAFHDSRQWCFLSLKPGADPLKALIESFLDTWQFSATDPERVIRHHGWMDALYGTKATLPDLIDATERRRKELDQPKPPGFFLYVDQGEELYARAEELQRWRFSELLAQALPDPRLRIMMSMRSDFLGHLQNDTPLFKVRQHIDVPPLGKEELREIVSRPAQLLSARFETDQLVEIITRRTAEDVVKDVGALPLLSYTLDDMWSQMVRRGDGTLRLPAQSFELGGVLVDRANRFVETHPGDEDALRRVLTLRLATVREDGEPTRRRAARAEFSDQEWRLVSELANYPNRLLVTVTTETGEIFAEVAHEAIFRRWDKLRDWIAAEREFLAWRTGLEAARRAWIATPDRSKDDALLMGLALDQAQSKLADRPADIPEIDRRFIELSRKGARRRRRRVQLLVARVAIGEAVILFAVFLGIIFMAEISTLWFEQVTLRKYITMNFAVHVLQPEAERALTPGDSFQECLKDCPEMVVIPPGEFWMGSPDGEGMTTEHPRHKVKIDRFFAVGKFAVTWDDWDACVSMRGCIGTQDNGFGRESRPVISVSWVQAKAYTEWLSRMTGKPYRLLTEAEWEYAARGVTSADAPHPPYPWGDQASHEYANYGTDQCCNGRVEGRDQWFYTAPVGQFPPNDFGLHDMHGNVWEWVEDRWHADYSGAPINGSAWTEGGEASLRVIRGGSWFASPEFIRSATRDSESTFITSNGLGFRVARTLIR